MCSCGNQTSVRVQSLRNGTTRSCGCLSKENFIGCRRTHGMTETSEYRIWTGIKTRCYNKNCAEYIHYGARGISLDKRWHDFPAFIADIGLRPSRKHAIERIDNDGNYEPGNCKWATMTEQARNRRNSRVITHDGRSMTIAEWSEVTGIGYGTLYSRLVLFGWDPARALRAA